MRTVWCIADSIVSPLGNTTEENYRAITDGKSAVAPQVVDGLPSRKYWVAKIQDKTESELPFFDQICRRACDSAMEGIALPSQRTLLILSTTKGNIDLVQHDATSPDVLLHHSAQSLGAYLGLQHYQVVSNACISGVLALIIAKRMINSGKYDHAVVVGADIVSGFVVSGFESLMALTDNMCRPFDANRNGINLGEAAACMVLSAEPEAIGATKKIVISGEGSSNDANHISGPSRTGAELALAINAALRTAGTTPSNIDFISAHGTATLYNDEMEAKAFNLCGLQHVPLNSLKAYYGHTLGAAGIVESVISVHSMLNGELVPTKGFGMLGVSQPVNVVTNREKKSMNRILKTASGFGGCNAAIVFEQ